MRARVGIGRVVRGECLLQALVFCRNGNGGQLRRREATGRDVGSCDRLPALERAEGEE